MLFVTITITVTVTITVAIVITVVVVVVVVVAGSLTWHESTGRPPEGIGRAGATTAYIHPQMTVSTPTGEFIASGVLHTTLINSIQCKDGLLMQCLLGRC